MGSPGLALPLALVRPPEVLACAATLDLGHIVVQCDDRDGHGGHHVHREPGAIYVWLDGSAVVWTGRGILIRPEGT